MNRRAMPRRDSASRDQAARGGPRGGAPAGNRADVGRRNGAGSVRATTTGTGLTMPIAGMAAIAVAWQWIEQNGQLC